MLNWTPWAIPGLIVLVGGLALAYFVYRARPDRLQNRLLALQLVAEALAVGLIAGTQWIFAAPGVVELLGLTSMFIVWPKLWTYYSFLATLDTPLAAPLKRRGVLPGLLAVTLVAAMSVLLRPGWYSGGVSFWPQVGGQHMAPGTLFIPVFWMWSIMWVVGLVFSVSAVRQARTAIRREQARAYLLAFGFRDVGFVAMAALFTFVPPTFRYFHLVFLLFPAIWLIYYPLVAWGILRHQLFAIELRVKRGLERSVVAGVIAAGFFVGAYALEELVAGNNFVVGLVMAAIVTMVFRPLQRFSERLADRMMPGVEASEAYLGDRRHEVYRNAIEAAMQDGQITDRERAILAQLQLSLEVDGDAARRIEREVGAALAPANRGMAAAVAG